MMNRTLFSYQVQVCPDPISCFPPSLYFKCMYIIIISHATKKGLEF